MTRADAIHLVASSLPRLEVAVAGRDAYLPARVGRWSVVQYLWHTVDVLRYGAERLWTLDLDPARGLAAWDENDIARARNYSALSPVVGLRAYASAVNVWLDAAQAAPSDTRATHPEFGILNALDVIRRNSHEVEHHLADILGTIRDQGGSTDKSQG
jgi:hypothetical protein